MPLTVAQAANAGTLAIEVTILSAFVNQCNTAIAAGATLNGIQIYLSGSPQINLSLQTNAFNTKALLSDLVTLSNNLIASDIAALAAYP